MTKSMMQWREVKKRHKLKDYVNDKHYMGASGSVMVSKLDYQTFTFKYHRVPYLYGLVPHLMKKLRKLLLDNKH